MADDFTRLIQALYAEADLLTPIDWKSVHLTSFHRLCAAEAMESSTWQQSLDEVEKRIKGAWENYRSLLVTERERTAETQAGHRLLVEGLAGWLEAVELCRVGDFEAAREAAVEANRLLILVQRQGLRLSHKMH
ncbi:MAG: hypothetical protein WC314_14155 [Vulcanimicrobiota bacterium]